MLVITVTMGPSRIVTQINTVENRKFSKPDWYLPPPLSGSAWNFAKALMLYKLKG